MNKLQQKLKQVDTGVREPDDGAVQWEFGQIKEVDEETQRVRIVMFSPRGDLDIGFHPLRKGEGGLADLQTRYGKLSPLMCCIVHFRGKRGPRPGTTFIEIIGKGPKCGGQAVIDEAEPEPNELTTGPFLLFSGGMMP